MSRRLSMVGEVLGIECNGLKGEGWVVNGSDLVWSVVHAGGMW